MPKSTRTHEENVDIGRRKQAVGASFESWIDAQHDGAKTMGLLGHVEHNQARAQFLGGKLVYTACGVSDYTLLLPGGMYGAVEAKSTQRDHLSKSAVSPRQAMHLEAVARAGGIALLLVEFRHKDGRMFRYAAPWLDVPWAVKRTVLSVSEADLQAFAVPFGKCYLEKYVTGRLPPSSITGRRIFPRE